MRHETSLQIGLLTSDAKSIVTATTGFAPATSSRHHPRRSEKDQSVGALDVAPDKGLILISARRSRGSDHWDADEYDVRLGEANPASAPMSF